MPTPSSTKPTQGTGSLKHPWYLFLRQEHFRVRSAGSQGQPGSWWQRAWEDAWQAGGGGGAEALGCGLHSQACWREVPDNPTFLVVWPPLGGGGRGCEKGKHTGCVPSLQDLKQTPTGKRWAPFSGRERSDMQLVLVMSQRSCFLAPAFHQRQAAALSPVSPYLVFAKPSEGSCCSPNSTDDDTEGQGQAHGQDSNPGLADSKVVPAALRALPLRLPIQGPNTTPGHGRCQ